MGTTTTKSRIVLACCLGASCEPRRRCVAWNVCVDVYVGASAHARACHVYQGLILSIETFSIFWCGQTFRVAQEGPRVEAYFPPRLLHGGEIAAAGTRAADPAEAWPDEGIVAACAPKSIPKSCVDEEVVGMGRSPCRVSYFCDSAGMLDGEHVGAPVHDERPRCAAADRGHGRAQVGGHGTRTRR